MILETPLDTKDPTFVLGSKLLSVVEQQGKPVAISQTTTEYTTVTGFVVYAYTSANRLQPNLKYLGSLNVEGRLVHYYYETI